MKHRKKSGRRAVRAASVVLSLLLTAVLFAIPAFADTAADSAAVPFYFTPIGMMAILFAVAMCVVGIVAWIRSCVKRGKKEEAPTVIPLEPKLPSQTGEAESFEQDVARYAREEAEKEAAADKKELNRAINEVLYAETLADRRERLKKEAGAEPDEAAEPNASETVPVAALNAGETTETEPVCAQTEQAADISGDLADRVERRTDRTTDADDVTGADPLAAKAAAYHTAFEEAKNISADCSDAIELTEDTEPEPETETTEPEAVVPAPADISPVVTGELEEELEQAEQSLPADAAEVEQAVADIRDSALAEGEEPIELVEETEETEAEQAPEVAAPEETEAAEPAEEAGEAEPETEPEAETEEIPEEPAAAAFVEVTEEPEPEETEETEEPDEADEDEADDSDEDEAEGAEGAEPEEEPMIPGGQRIVYIDAKANPEAYAELLEQEARGEVTLVYRYRKSFLAKMSGAEETVKSYYNEVKNALLAFKGVKCRTSWGYEAFNKGRVKLARMDVKTKSLYLYLAIDPASLADTKYTFKDMSEKKKYAATPVLMKIRGERKFRHALELIEKICGEELQLKRTGADAVDYRLPMMSQEELVEAGYVKMMVGAIPTSPVQAAEPAEAAETGVAEAETSEPETVEAEQAVTEQADAAASVDPAAEEVPASGDSAQ